MNIWKTNHKLQLFWFVGILLIACQTENNPPVSVEPSTSLEQPTVPSPANPVPSPEPSTEAPTEPPAAAPTETPPPVSRPAPPATSAPTIAARPNFAESTGHPIFQGLIDKLKATTKVPLVLPSYVPEADGSTPIYAIPEDMGKSQYRLMLAYTEDCNGGTACRLGGVMGEAAATASQPLSGEAVKLNQGITGYFTDATCGANCSDSTLTWEENGGRYTVAIKAGKVDELVKMANSAIASP